MTSRERRAAEAERRPAAVAPDQQRGGRGQQRQHAETDGERPARRRGRGGRRAHRARRSLQQRRGLEAARQSARPQRRRHGDRASRGRERRASAGCSSTAFASDGCVLR